MSGEEIGVRLPGFAFVSQFVRAAVTEYQGWVAQTTDFSGRWKAEIRGPV